MQNISRVPKTVYSPTFDPFEIIPRSLLILIKLFLSVIF